MKTTEGTRVNSLRKASLIFVIFLGLVTIIGLGGCSGAGENGGSREYGEDGNGDDEQDLLPSSPVIEITSVSLSSVWLNWTLVDNATEYRIYFATQQGVTPQNYMSLPNSGMVKASAPPENVWLSHESELYYLIVTALNQFGESAPSNELSVRPWGEVIDATMRPPKRGLMPGVFQWFVLDGTVSGGQLRNVTERFKWSSSDPSVISIGPQVENVQYVLGVSAGRATITAELDELVYNADVVVWPIAILEVDIPLSLGTTEPTVGIDDTGNALAAWAYYWAGELRVYGYNIADGWTGPTLLDTKGDWATHPMLDVAGSGMAHMVWEGLDGIYSAEYIPGKGWHSTEKISSNGGKIKVAIGADGDGVSIWGEGGKIMSASFSSGLGWSVPTEVGKLVGSDGQLLLAGNDNGTAIAVWENWETTWTLNASIYQPGAGWTAPVILDQQSIYMNPNIDIAEDGTIVVAWLDNSLSGTIYLSLFEPGTGWLATEVVQTEAYAPSVEVAVSDGGDVMVAWICTLSGELNVRHRNWFTGWEATQILIDAFGTRKLHMASVGAGGVILLEVGKRYVGDQDWARIHRYELGTGWQPEDILHAGIGILERVTIDTSPSGQIIIGWNEHYTLFDGSVYSEHEDLLVLTNP